MKALADIGIYLHRQGKVVHDGYASYFKETVLEHALCNAHHLRQLQFIEERYKQPWAHAMMELLLAIKEAVEQAKTQGRQALHTEEITGFEVRYTDLLAQGHKVNAPPETEAPVPKKRGRRKQSPAKNLLDHLQRYREKCWPSCTISRCRLTTIRPNVICA